MSCGSFLGIGSRTDCWLGRGTGFLLSCMALAVPAANAGGDRGILEVDPQSGAASLRLPLGPGVGRAGLKYVPALVGHFAPQVGLVPLGDENKSSKPMAVLLSATGFQLSPGTLDLSLVTGDSSGTIPVARWTYPDGTGGRTRGERCNAGPAQSFWRAFGYTSGQKGTAVASPSRTAFAGDPVLSGLGGEVLLALPEAAAGPGLEDPGRPGQGGFPSRLLAVRGELAYEYQAETGRDPRASAAGSARYRLSAIRAATGETVTFTYGPNGVDFEAAWEAAKVRVTLAGTSAAAPVPALDAVDSDPDARAQSRACREVEAHLQVAYEGPTTIPGYTIKALVHPEAFMAEGKLAEEGTGAAGRGPVDPDAFRHALQVSRVEGWPSGEAITFGYGKASAVSPEGSAGTLSLAPTVLREIALPGRTLALDWEGAPQPRLGGESRGDETMGHAWCFGVAALHDQEPSGHEAETKGSSYRRPVPEQSQGSSWVRQSRHYAFLPDPETGATCRTYVRDRWELGMPATGAEDPERRIPYDSDGDIPTFEFDPQAGGLVPAAGQFTRWLNWKAGAGGRVQAPDLHGGRPHVAERMRLLGGMMRNHSSRQQVAEMNRQSLARNMEFNRKTQAWLAAQSQATAERMARDAEARRVQQAEWRNQMHRETQQRTLEARARATARASEMAREHAQNEAAKAAKQAAEAKRNKEKEEEKAVNAKRQESAAKRLLTDAERRIAQANQRIAEAERRARNAGSNPSAPPAKGAAGAGSTHAAPATGRAAGACASDEADALAQLEKYLRQEEAEVAAAQVAIVRMQVEEFRQKVAGADAVAQVQKFMQNEAEMAEVHAAIARMQAEEGKRRTDAPTRRIGKAKKKAGSAGGFFLGAGH